MSSVIMTMRLFGSYRLPGHIVSLPTVGWPVSFKVWFDCTSRSTLTLGWNVPALRPRTTWLPWAVESSGTLAWSCGFPRTARNRTRRSWIALLQPQRIHHPHRISPGIDIGVHIARQPDGVGLEVAAGGGVVVAILIVVEVGEGLLLTGKAEQGDGGEGGCGAGAAVAAGGDTEVGTVQPVQRLRAARAIGGGDRQRVRVDGVPSDD